MPEKGGAIEAEGGWKFSTYRSGGRVYSRARRGIGERRREEIHLGPVRMETVKVRGCFTVRVIVSRILGRAAMSVRRVNLRTNLILLWIDALLNENGWKSGNQIQIVVGHDEMVSDPVVAALRSRTDKYNRDQLYLTWKWDGTYGAGKRKPLVFAQCATCEKQARDQRLARDVRAGRYLRKGQKQLASLDDEGEKGPEKRSRV